MTTEIASDQELEACGAEPLPGNRGVELQDWRIEFDTGPMAGAMELEDLGNSIKASVASDSPLPEVVFAQNRLKLTHETSGIVLSFDACGALTLWARASAEHGAAGMQVPTPASALPTLSPK